MSETILNEILLTVKNTNENVEKLEEEMKQALNEQKEEIMAQIREEMKQALNEQKEEIMTQIREEMKQALNEQKEEIMTQIREEMEHTLNQQKDEIIKRISADVGKELNNVMIVINKVENERKLNITKELRNHEEKAIKGVELLKQTLVG